MSTLIAQAEPPWQRNRLIVPREQGSLLIRPSRAQIPALLQRNRLQFDASSNLKIGGLPLSELRKLARAEVLNAALHFTSLWTSDLPDPDPSLPLIVSGHQPQLVHPGTWCKNLLLGKLAQETNALALNLVVDNDLLKSPSLVVPAGTRNSPEFKSIPYDTLPLPTPWEEAHLREESLSRDFPDRVSAPCGNWGFQPVLPAVWKTVLDLLPQHRNWAFLLTAARNSFERRFKIRNLELPLSCLSLLPCFRRFVVDILTRLDDFQSVHNRLLTEFRNIYRIRSDSHPVPPLKNSGLWREAPFWVWRSGETHRRPLLVRQDATAVQFSDGESGRIEVPIAHTSPAGTWEQLLLEMERRGWKVRPRALTTTLFVRLLLADLFLHGIGGAHYDEITDRLLVRFYGIPSPVFVTVSAGELLPLPAFPVHDSDEQFLRQQLRDHRYNPERHDLDNNSLSQQKFAINSLRADLQQQNLTDNRKSFKSVRQSLHRQLREGRRELLAQETDSFNKLQQSLSTLQAQLHANRILKSREYSFAIFPEENLSSLLSRL